MIFKGLLPTEKRPSFLIINPFGIGDVLFSTPLIRNIKEYFPDSRIYYLCNKRAYPVLRFNPLIEKIFIYERDEFEEIKRVSKLKWVKKGFSFISEIRKENINVTIDLSLNSQYGFFSFLAGIRKRVGLDYKRRGCFLTRKIKIEGFESKHVADYYLDALKLLGIEPKPYNLEVYASKESREKVDNFLKGKVFREDLVIGIAPCGGKTLDKQAFRKRWPERKFSLLTERIISELGAKIFIFAGPDEAQDVERIISNINSDNIFNFTGLGLEEVIALIEKCFLFLGNDSGLLKVANALDKKIVAIFGPVSEKVYGLYPFKPSQHIILKKDLPCRPCYKQFRLPECPYDIACLRDITVEEAFSAVSKLISS